MKIKMMLVLLIMVTIVFAGCGNKEEEGAGTTTTPQPTQAAATTAPTATATQTPAGTTAPTAGADVVTTASIVNTEEAFLNAISANGTWIICLLQDMTIDQELMLEGEYKNGKKDDAGNDIIQRKIALYTQDENRTVTARFTLTAPKLTVTSPNARIQSGTFKGDLYIGANNFELVDATVEGNVVFMKQEYQDSFTMDETSKVTGTQSVEE
jgi:hypothetical protein